MLLNIGPLVLVAILYEIIGIVIALTVKRIFWVPHRFRYGVLVAGGWGNYGDIPTSVVMSIAGAAPFNGTTDQTLSVAYVSAFILVFFVSLHITFVSFYDLLRHPFRRLHYFL